MTVYRGLKYPLEVKDGRLLTVSDLSITEQNILEVLETRPTERVMRVDYGFDPKIFNTMEPNAINARIVRAVTTYVPSVSQLEVIGNMNNLDSGTYQVTLKYKVNGVPAPPLTINLSA
jgi:phage baseplate assembly protein W